MKTTKPPVSRESDKFMLRLPEGMRDRIATASATNGRSMNAEVIARLEASFTSVKSAIPWPDLIDLLKEEAAERGAVLTITFPK